MKKKNVSDWILFGYSLEIELHRESESGTTYRRQLLQYGERQWPLHGVWREPEPGSCDGGAGPRSILHSGINRAPRAADACALSSACTPALSPHGRDDGDGHADAKPNAAATSPPPRRHCYDCRKKVTATPYGAPPASYICTCGPRPRTFPRAPTVNFQFEAVLWYWWTPCLRFANPAALFR